ncbi:methyltransferase domain-containing protein [Rhodococcus koreensis]|uniref:methyltransferase domain-containing protein n=1 Tax=Rhodococcus koreensis TaxID=99653 RepID=UPI00366B9A52
MLAGALAEHTLSPLTRVLDICTGTGALALRVAQLGAGRVTVIEISRRAVLTARLNARLHGHTIRVLQGSLTVRDWATRSVVERTMPPSQPGARRW